MNSALALVSGSMDDMANLNPTTSLNQSSVRALADVGVFAAFGGAWTNSSAVKLPDNSDTSVSVKDFMGKQLDPAATGISGDGREFAINVFVTWLGQTGPARSKSLRIWRFSDLTSRAVSNYFNKIFIKDFCRFNP